MATCWLLALPRSAQHNLLSKCGSSTGAKWMRHSCVVSCFTTSALKSVCGRIGCKCCMCCFAQCVSGSDRFLSDIPAHHVNEPWQSMVSRSPQPSGFLPMASRMVRLFCFTSSVLQVAASIGSELIVYTGQTSRRFKFTTCICLSPNNMVAATHPTEKYFSDVCYNMEINAIVIELWS